MMHFAMAPRVITGLGPVTRALLSACVFLRPLIKSSRSTRQAPFHERHLIDRMDEQGG
jgi:hypothetical protein